jgi:peroxiredoxin
VVDHADKRFVGVELLRFVEGIQIPISRSLFVLCSVPRNRFFGISKNQFHKEKRMMFMNYFHKTLAAIVVLSAAVVCGCSSDAGSGESQDSDSPTVSRGEHDHNGGEHEHDEGKHNRDGGKHDGDGDGHHAATIHPKAGSIFSAMAVRLQSADRFHVEFTVALTAKEGDRPFEAKRDYSLAVQRPDRFRLELISQSGSPYGLRQFSLFTDGTALKIRDHRRHQYSINHKDTTLTELSNDSGVREFLYWNLLDSEAIVASLLSPNPYDTLIEDAINLAYVAKERVGAEDCHHIRFEGQRDSWDAWITTTSQTLLRVELDLSYLDAASRLAGKPETDRKLTLQFTNWKLNDIKEHDFSWTPGEDYEKVDTLGPQSHHLTVGQKMPNVVLQSLDGGQCDLAKHHGKEVVVLDFWATWCGPCIRGLPELVRLGDEYKDQNVAFYAVNRGEQRDYISDVLDKRKLRLPVLLDTDETVTRALSVRGMPHIVVVDKEGTIVGVYHSLSKSLVNQLQSLLTPDHP